MTTPTIANAVERWSERAVRGGWVTHWQEGAIYPAEMVFLLATCEANGVRTVVESGRQDGYSTMLLGHYAEAVSARVVSIDVEADPARAARCRERLAHFSRLELVVGDATEELGRAVGLATGPTAVLIDGPKGFAALRLLFATAAFPHVRVLAQHNLEPGLPETTFAFRAFGRPVHYESVVGEGGIAWQQLREAEREFCGSLNARRRLDTSSLAVAVVDGSEGRRLSRFTARELGLLQPPVIAAAWRARAYALPRLAMTTPARAAHHIRRLVGKR